MSGRTPEWPDSSPSHEKFSQRYSSLWCTSGTSSICSTAPAKPPLLWKMGDDHPCAPRFQYTSKPSTPRWLPVESCISARGKDSLPGTASDCRMTNIGRISPFLCLNYYVLTFIIYNPSLHLMLHLFIKRFKFHSLFKKLCSHNHNRPHQYYFFYWGRSHLFRPLKKSRTLRLLHCWNW